MDIMDNKDELIVEYNRITKEIERIRQEELEPLREKVREAYIEIKSTKNERQVWSLYKRIYRLNGEINKIKTDKLYQLSIEQFNLSSKIKSINNSETKKK